MAHPRWRAGKLSTSFIPEEFPNGFHPREPAGESAQVLAAVAAHIDFVLRERKQRISGQEISPPKPSRGERVVRFDKTEIPLEIERAREGFSVRFGGNGDIHRLESSWNPGNRLWRGRYDQRVLAVQVRSVLNAFELVHHGIAARVHIYSPHEAEAARLMPAQASSNSGKSLRCPMPGLVVSIAVTAGQEVKTGEPLAVVEAMKMENVLRADRDGVVRRVLVKPGETLTVDQVMMEFA
jgi:propionyl-CoA carboxylase alpha chain